MLNEEKISTVLKFYPNPQHQIDATRSAHVSSCFRGIIVFPKGDLPQRIIDEDLTGKSVYVKLIIRSTGENSGFYTAYPDTTGPLTVPGETINGNSRVAILIDGQNFMGSLGSIRRNQRVALEAHTLLERVLSQYNPFQVSFYICAEQLHGRATTLNHAEKFALQNHRIIHLETFESKIASGNANPKTDADKIIIPDLAFWVSRATTDIDGVVLLSGDSDYARTCQMIAGIGNRYAKYGAMPIDIISGHNELSSDLREVGNHPNCRLFFLEDFV